MRFSPSFYQTVRCSPQVPSSLLLACLGKFLLLLFFFYVLSHLGTTLPRALSSSLLVQFSCLNSWSLVAFTSAPIKGPNQVVY